METETVHDFRRADILGPGHLRRLQKLHAGLTGDFAAALSDLLRFPVDVRLASVDQIAYGQFVGGLAAPSCFNILKAAPLQDRLLLDIEPAILYPMIDRLLGGRGDEPPPGRPLSDLELPLAARVVRLFLEHLNHAWQNSLDLNFEVLQVESNPRLSRVLPTDEMVVMVTFELIVGDLQGRMRLCLPCRMMQRIDENHRQAQAQCNEETSVEVAVTLATTPIAADELESLRIGDIIATETPVGSPAVVSIDGEAQFHAKPGVCRGRKAVRLTEAIKRHPVE